MCDGDVCEVTVCEGDVCVKVGNGFVSFPGTELLYSAQHMRGTSLSHGRLGHLSDT